MLKRRQQGQVAILTIDRANRRNALGTELMQALSEAFAEIDRDDGVAAVVISATPPGFCAGSDLKELATMDIAQMCAHEAETARVVRAIGFMEKPAIAAVSGFALGGGVGLAAGCDLIVTHPECRWHMPEVPNGWLPPWALASLSVRIGPVAARRLVWASEPITGAEAYHLKLADYLVPLSDVEARGNCARRAARGAAARRGGEHETLLYAPDQRQRRGERHACKSDFCRELPGRRIEGDAAKIRHESLRSRGYPMNKFCSAETAVATIKKRPDGCQRRRDRLDHAGSGPQEPRRALSQRRQSARSDVLLSLRDRRRRRHSRHGSRRHRRLDEADRVRLLYQSAEPRDRQASRTDAADPRECDRGL